MFRKTILGLLVGFVAQIGWAACDSSTPPTFTSRAGLSEPVINACGWGATTNANWSIVDSSMCIQGVSNTFTSTNTFNYPIILQSGQPMRFYDANGHYISMQSPATVSTTQFYWPTADGLNGQVLSTNGSGQWAFVNPGNASSLLSTTNTWTATQSFNSIVSVNGEMDASNGAGTSGYVLKTNGAGSAPTWVNANLISGSTNYIQNTSSLQSGSTFYVSSGTISGNLTVSSLTLTTAGLTNTILATNAQGIIISTTVATGGSSSVVASTKNNVAYYSGTATNTINGILAGTTNYGLLSGGTNGIPFWNQVILGTGTLQTGATFYVSSGTVAGPFNTTTGNVSLGDNSSSISAPTFGNGAGTSTFIRVVAAGGLLGARSIASVDLPATVVTSTATVTVGDCAQFSASAGIIDSGNPCGTGGGGGGGASGQVNTATQYSAPYYSVAGSSNVISGISPGTTNYALLSGGIGAKPFFNAVILSTETLQSNATFYVSSGTINGGNFYVNSNPALAIAPSPSTGTIIINTPSQTTSAGSLEYNVKTGTILPNFSMTISSGAGTSYNATGLTMHGSGSISSNGASCAGGLIYGQVCLATTGTSWFGASNSTVGTVTTLTSTTGTFVTSLTASSSTVLSGNVAISSTVLLSGSAGTNGQVLTSGGPGTIPSWTTVSSGGGGSTAIAISSGMPGNSVIVSSPTSNVIFSSTSFVVNLIGTTSSYVLPAIQISTESSTNPLAFYTSSNTIADAPNLTYSPAAASLNVPSVFELNGGSIINLSATTIEMLGDTNFDGFRGKNIADAIGTTDAPSFRQTIHLATGTLQSGATFYVSSGTVAGQLTISSGVVTTGVFGVNGLAYNWPSSQSLNFLKNDGAGNLTWAAASGGGGSSTLAISSGSATNSVIVSSPTSNVVFDSNTVTVNLQGSTSDFLTLSPSSVTLQGNAITFTQLATSTGTLYTLANGKVAYSSFSATNPITYNSATGAIGIGGVSLSSGVVGTLQPTNMYLVSLATGILTTSILPSANMVSTTAFTTSTETFTAAQTITSSFTVLYATVNFNGVNMAWPSSGTVGNYLQYVSSNVLQWNSVASGGGSGSGGYALQPATVTIQGNAGITASTMTVSSNTVLSGATFYQNGPINFANPLNIATVGAANILSLSTSSTATAILTVSSNVASASTDYELNITSGSGTQLFAVANGTGIIAGETISFSSTTLYGIKGSTVSDNAATGNIGEYISSTTAGVGKAFPASGNFGDALSITLTPGDWDISAICEPDANGATVSSGVQFGISTTSGNSATGLVTGDNSVTVLPPTAINDPSAAIPVWRRSISTTTTFYFKYAATYSVATPNFFGRISARRIR